MDPDRTNDNQNEANPDATQPSGEAQDEVQAFSVDVANDAAVNNPPATQSDSRQGFPFKELTLTAVASAVSALVVGVGLFYILISVIDTGSGLGALGIGLALGAAALAAGFAVSVVIAGLMAKHWGINNPWSVGFVGLVFGVLIQGIGSRLPPVGVNDIESSIGASGALGVVIGVGVLAAVAGLYLAYYLINGSSYEVDSAASKSRARLWLAITIVMLILSPYVLGVLVG